MLSAKNILLTVGPVLLFSCGEPERFVEDDSQKESYVQSAADYESMLDNQPDTTFISGKSVVFFAPGAGDLEKLIHDSDTREGVRQAIGDFAYYASIVSDSLESRGIPVYFTENTQIVFDQHTDQLDFYPRESTSLIGLVLFDGDQELKVLPGMQTHLSVLSSVEDFFLMDPTESVALLDYFDEADPGQIHVYSSHSDILNQAGNRISTSHYGKFGRELSARADRFHMSLYGYSKIKLSDTVYAVICRVPSKYDESSIRMYLWDQQNKTVLNQIELAENIWNEQWIMVKDSWVSFSKGSDLTIVQRKKEASISDGKRTETDSLYQWQLNGQEFVAIPTTELVRRDFQLKDWGSYQEAPVRTEMSFVDEDYVWLPLETGDLTWENIILDIPKPFSLKKDPIENSLVKGQIDTLITVQQDKLSFKFYQSPIGIMIVEGNVSTPSFHFKKGLKVGMTKANLTRQFNQFKQGVSIPDLVKISSMEADRVISFRFSNDTLQTIEITNYLH